MGNLLAHLALTNSTWNCCIAPRRAIRRLRAAVYGEESKGQSILASVSMLKIHIRHKFCTSVIGICAVGHKRL